MIILHQLTIPPTDTPAQKTITGVAQDPTTPAFATEEDIKYQGLDPRMFSDDGNITINGAKSVIEELKQAKALAEKQRDDFHKTLSAKGQVPKKVEDYIDKYSNPRYESIKSNPSVNESMKQLAETFHKNGINPKEG